MMLPFMMLDARREAIEAFYANINLKSSNKTLLQSQFQRNKFVIKTSQKFSLYSFIRKKLIQLSLDFKSQSKSKNLTVKMKAVFLIFLLLFLVETSLSQNSTLELIFEEIGSHGNFFDFESFQKFY